MGSGRKKTHEEFLKEVYDLVGDEYEVLGEYNKAKLSILFKHIKCAHEFQMQPSNFLNGNRCPKCAGKIKPTYEEVKIFVENLGYELISDKYINGKTKLILKDFEGYYYTIRLNNLKFGKKPNKYHKNNPYTIQNIKLWLILNNKNFELISNEYISNNKKLKWKCLKEDCKEEFESSWNNISNQDNVGCPFCSGHQVGLSNCLATKNPELAKEWHLILNGKLTPFDVTSNSHDKVWWKCKDCEHEWKATIANRNYNGRGCPKCNESKGEKRINEVLINNNWIKINQEIFEQLTDENKYNKNYYIPQKEFNGLIGLGNGNLSYDFYLPKYNMLIEYQGEQHERYIHGFHKTKKDFEKQVEHDRRKKEYAKNHNIELLEIWYWDFDKIEEILINF